MNIEILERKLRTGSRSRDFQWYRKLFVKDRLYIGADPMTAAVFEHFRLAVKTVEEIYPGAWDIEFGVDSYQYLDNKVIINLRGINIKFPEVTIRNSVRKSHLIKDLFILTRFRIYDNKLRIEGVYGTRTTLTYAEYNSRYLHSHLNKNRIDPSYEHFYFQKFCTGSGSINIAMADLNAQGFNAERFISYLLNLDTLASWESLEGVPYVKIASINSLEEGTQMYNSARSDVAKMFITALKRFATSVYKPEIDFMLEHSGVSLADNDRYKEFLHRVPLTDTDKKYLLCFKSEEGVYYSYGQTPRAAPLLLYPNKYLFQGEEIEIKITNPPENATTEIQYEFHPKIKLEIKKQLEYAANKAILRKTTVDRYKNSTSDIRENPQPDPVPVPTDSESGVEWDIVL